MKFFSTKSFSVKLFGPRKCFGSFWAKDADSEIKQLTQLQLTKVPSNVSWPFLKKIQTGFRTILKLWPKSTCTKLAKFIWEIPYSVPYETGLDNGGKHHI